MRSAATTPRKGRPKRATRRLRSKGNARGPRTRKQIAFAIFKWGAIAGLALSALAAVTVAAFFWIYASDSSLPNPSSLAEYNPRQVSRIVTDNGEVIGEIYAERGRRTYVPYDRLPKHLVQAFVSAEDANFWEHEGIDYMGMLRALIVNLRTGKHTQGGSTITQQVVKNLLLTPEKTLKRKFQEIILARRLESQLSKEEILTLYANEIYFGEGRYGVQEAARFYFGKNVEDINVGEAAMLAGLPKAPNTYSPRRKGNQENAKRRQMYVLGQMVQNGYISREEAQKWIDRPIEVVADPYPLMGQAPEWIGIVKDELVKRYGEDGLDKAGVRVVTTLDLDVQRLAKKALQEDLRAYDKRRGYGRPVRKVRPDKIDLVAARLARRLKGGPKPGVEYRAVVREVFDDPGEMVVDLGKWKASVLLDTKPGRYNVEGKKPSERFERGDIVRVKLARNNPLAPKERKPAHSDREVVLAEGPQGALVVLDPKTRRVLAVVGGYDVGVGDFNRATMAKRQAGSTFKPFVYAAAIDSGDFTPASIVNDAPEVYNLWKPENYEKGEFEGPVRIRHALARSINTVSIRVTYDIGPERVAQVAHMLGIQSDLPETLSLALGSGEVTPLELTNAFATFAAGGETAEPRFIEKIIDGDKTIEVEHPEPQQVLRPEVAYVVLDMMRTVVQKGTGHRASKLGLDIGGKTGTSNDARDAWFIGVSPSLAVGVWVGFDDFKHPLGHGEQGSRTALPAFVAVMGKLGKRSDRFERPPGVVEAVVDEKTGLLAPEGQTEGTYTEVFVEGTAPTEFAPAPGEVDTADYVLDQYGDESSDGAEKDDPGETGAPAGGGGDHPDEGGGAKKSEPRTEGAAP